MIASIAKNGIFYLKIVFVILVKCIGAYIFNKTPSYKLDLIQSKPRLGFLKRRKNHTAEM